ncbi:ABC transporter ATP-binding protein [Leptothrix discophora]|uniref:ABC transporter ATP-binding protein n=1 Tax=Leptothrix discophora TaxID=89 RepID=A0ABT9G829_LEPDI|nr:ABC transporter ATP-binding protein [Leptothrix discophora]MDP4302649.1 ABC transporter ATP-binding protein [Leptothrix discophora]
MTAPLDPPDPARAPSGALQLDTYRLTRRFGAFTALDDVTLTVRPGTVHALLGENGAGKSTLVKCVVGYQPPSAGSVLIDGREQAIGSPTVARALGIGMVYQHFTVVPGMTVAENLLLARGKLPAWIDWKAVRRELSAFLETTPFRLDLDATPADLSAGEKQKLEILKQLYLKPRLLILDEPTSVLTPQEADEVLGALRERAHAGDCSIVMITHKFREVSAYADDVSVLRRGRLIHTGAVADTTPQKLAEAMVGGGGAAPAATAEVVAELAAEQAHDLSHPKESAAPAAPSGPARLQIRGLHVMGDRGEPAVQGFDLDARAGEIVGVAGVSGNGQRELMEALVGQRPRTAGTVTVSGEAYAARRAQNRRLKVRSLPEEPLRNACVGHLSVARNMSLRSFDDPAYSRAGWVRWGRLKARARAWITAYGVKTRGEDAPIRTLSGGNVQRAVLARELGEPADLLLVANPVFGLDFAAVAEIHARLRAARDGGTAVLLVSEDLDELLALSDRIVVMSEGRIVYGCAASGADRHTLGAHMGGHGAAHEETT